MVLQEAHAVTLVGTPTAGANGGATLITLPGGGQMRFTGMRWLRSDGSRFQNIGVIPEVFIEPTIEGLAAGRDEVLDKGIETARALIQRRAVPDQQ